jgi:transposase
MKFICGEEREQTILFPERIEDYIEEDNVVRIIEAFINSLDLERLGFSRVYPKDTGRPPYDPADILKLYVYGYMNRIRSSRRLETECKRNFEVIWLMRKLSPDHKTISDFRKNNPKALKNVFRDFVKLCLKLDLYGKELVAIDGSKFKAVNSKDNNFTKGKLQDRLKRIDDKIDEYLKELDKTDIEEDKVDKKKSKKEIERILKELTERKNVYNEYSKELESSGETQKSVTDSDSRLMPSNGKMDVCYNVQAVVDSKHKLITEFEVTNKANDMNQLTPVMQKVQEILEVKEIAVAADAGYASASDIAAAVQLGIEPHVAGTDFHICLPVVAAPADESAATTTDASIDAPPANASVEDAIDGEEKGITSHVNGRCVYIKERNIAICPMGKALHPKHYKKSKGEAVFHNTEVCATCKCRCTKEERGFRYQFVMPESDFSTEYNDKDLEVKQILIKPDKEKYEQRKSLSEHPFGTIKRNMDAGYCLLKGKEKVTGEFSLVFLAYNLKRVINTLGGKKLIEKIKNLANVA